jgi:hypothetical protein
LQLKGCRAFGEAIHLFITGHTCVGLDPSNPCAPAVLLAGYKAFHNGCLNSRSWCIAIGDVEHRLYGCLRISEDQHIRSWAVFQRAIYASQLSVVHSGQSA